jgi:flavin reductase (DIM6/NTAB) family NADH-FMN oxidoreductase RutF
MLFDYAKKDISDRYNLMAQTIIPRPIAWIVTEDAEGIVNIAPFSYFTGLSSNPPTLVVSVGHKSDGSPKDTLFNLRKNRKCTLCLVDEAHLKPMHLSSKTLPHETSEADYFNIPIKKVLENFPPMIEGVPAAFFCTLYQEIDLKGSKTIPLVLEIKKQYISDASLGKEGDKVTISFKPIARIGKKYAHLGEEIEPPEIPL